MPRPYPEHRRRRPGRRPPNRHRGDGAPRPPRHGFTGPGLRSVYNMFMPLRGREKRSYLNRAAGIIALTVAYVGAVLGYGWFGPLGAVVGFVSGLAAGCSFLERRRFYRG